MKTTNNKQQIIEAFKNSIFQLDLGNKGRADLKLSEALTLFKQDYSKENTNGYNLIAYILLFNHIIQLLQLIRYKNKL